MSSSNTKMHGEEDEEEVLSDLTESLTLMPQIIEKYETRFLRVEQSELYKPTGMVMPKLPLYHPYHPFKNNTNDDILQVPLAMTLPNADLAPSPLVEYIKKKNIDAPIISFLTQTLPYESETEVICRYQYALFPEAKGEMKGHQSIWAQSVVYEKDKLFARIPPTQIKIYESEKGEVVSPTILCGDSMKLGNVEMLRGRGLWSLVLGSYTGTLGDDGFFTDVSHAFLGFTYFIPDDDAYLDFLRLIRKKSPREISTLVPDMIDMNTSRCVDTL